MRETEVQIGNSGLIAKPWLALDDVLKAHHGGKSMFHLIWYVLLAALGLYREIGDARAYDDLLDDRARRRH
jgi:hypothetical protein